jgi:hypothetical protein
MSEGFDEVARGFGQSSQDGNSRNRVTKDVVHYKFSPGELLPETLADARGIEDVPRPLCPRTAEF